MLTDDGYRQIMQHARRLAQGGRGELAQHLRDAIDLRAEVEALNLERAAAEIVHRETATTVLMQMAEVQRLRDAAQAFLVAYDADDGVSMDDMKARDDALVELRRALEGGE